MGGQIYFYQKYYSRETNFDFFSLFFKFPIFDFFLRGFHQELNIFGKKSRATPNPQVKIVGGTLNPDQIFASAATCAAPAGRGACENPAKKSQIWEISKK